MALTNVKQDCAVKPLVDNMILEDLIIEGLRAAFSCRHRELPALEMLGVRAIGKGKETILTRKMKPSLRTEGQDVVFNSAGL
jgi:hypothetical protein